MNISPVNDNNISMHGKVTDFYRRVAQKILDRLPSHTSKEGKKSVQNWDRTTYWTSHPMWNRGIMGATALLTQPAIDYYNHRVDDETRTVSRNRTIAKIVAGTLVGMFVARGPVYKAVEKMTNLDGKSKWSKFLLPEEHIKDLQKTKRYLKNYRATLSMALALIAMSITNFVLDAPLTIVFTNLLNEKSGISKKNKNDEDRENAEEVMYA